MNRIKFMYRQFLSEPLWFKIVISAMLLIAIVFSSSSFNGYYQGAAKIAAAIFFMAYGIKFRRSTRIALLFFAVAMISVYLSWEQFN
ncbi:hypothetical protein D3P08_18580 [Paenibacillus nanensis]|uniref:Uncharacterized protein n=1 Tax=Paenibacillus nanensis TaxID=393251 RepID=A0A3A1UR38_9BACL|nr:hypothetical protein [Paenibacillus nanensis]RIX50715.1 hypothetical protein D3P08_18580 [Paenibacillus nanensis]